MKDEKFVFYTISTYYNGSLSYFKVPKYVLQIQIQANQIAS